MYRYRAYGLNFSSDLALPVLLPAADKTDVVIKEGYVPDDIVKGMEFRSWVAKPGEFYIEFPRIGQIFVRDGCEIIYQRDPAADDSMLASTILGSAFAVILMQRGLVPLHSCAVLFEGQALLVMGKSGAGKSTLLGGLLAHGLSMMADDVTALAVTEDGPPLAYAGFPSARLWQDSLRLLGEPHDGLERVRSDTAKFYLPVEQFHEKPAPIRAIVHLSPNNGDELVIAELPLQQQVPSLSNFVFRKRFLAGLGLQQRAYRQIATTVGKVRMLKVVRPSRRIDPQLAAARLLDALSK